MAGKIETMTCLMFVIGFDNFDTTAKLKTDLFFQMIQQVLQTKIQPKNYRNCSTRYSSILLFSYCCRSIIIEVYEMKRDMYRCLLVRYMNRLFDIAHKLGLKHLMGRYLRY